MPEPRRLGVVVGAYRKYVGHDWRFLYSSRGIPLGVRSGHSERTDARPWETPEPFGLIEPRERHVSMLVIDEWQQGLAVAPGDEVVIDSGASKAV